MKMFSMAKLCLCSVLLIITLSACQPIQPLAQGSDAASICSDADKIALVQQYADAFIKKDTAAGVSLFLPDGKLGGTAGPFAETPTGEYTTVPVEFVGHEQISGIIGWFISVEFTNEIRDSTVQGDTVISNVIVRSPWWLVHGIPMSEAVLVFTTKVQECKIADLYWEYTEETLKSMPIKAKALADECSDSYKQSLFQDYLNGISEADNRLAVYPFADDALAEYDSAPVFDEASQSYVRGERNQWPGKAAIKQVFEYFISIQMTKSFDPAQFKITGQTLEAPVVVSTTSFASDFDLPLTDLESFYTVEFDENCRITHLNHTFTDEALVKLKAAR